jgi:hypothetical protein
MVKSALFHLANVGVKHQSINLFICPKDFFMSVVKKTKLLIEFLS